MLFLFLIVKWCGEFKRVRRTLIYHTIPIKSSPGPARHRLHCNYKLFVRNLQSLQNGTPTIDMYMVPAGLARYYRFSIFSWEPCHGQGWCKWYQKSVSFSIFNYYISSVHGWLCALSIQLWLSNVICSPVVMTGVVMQDRLESVAKGHTHRQQDRQEIGIQIMLIRDQINIIDIG